MNKIIGNPLVTPMRVPDWNQDDKRKSDYIKNKPDLSKKLGLWQPRTEYKAGDFVFAKALVFEGGDFEEHAYLIYECTADHISSDVECPYYEENWFDFWRMYYTPAQSALQDWEGNVIHLTYTTKEEFTDKHTWKLLGEATVTEANVTDAGEAGVMSIAVDCGDLSKYDELRINLQCRVNEANAGLNSNQRMFAVYILSGMDEPTNQGDTMLVAAQGSASSSLNPTHSNNMIINSYFTDGILQYSEILNNAYNAHNYRSTPSIALPSFYYKLVGGTGVDKLGRPVDLKSGKRLVLFKAVHFKFPAGTELKVYGR